MPTVGRTRQGATQGRVEAGCPLVFPHSPHTQANLQQDLPPRKSVFENKARATEHLAMAQPRSQQLTPLYLAGLTSPAPNFAGVVSGTHTALPTKSQFTKANHRPARSSIYTANVFVIGGANTPPIKMWTQNSLDNDSQNRLYYYYIPRAHHKGGMTLET